jgi:RHS repeat-associated protein
MDSFNLPTFLRNAIRGLTTSFSLRARTRHCVRKAQEISNPERGLRMPASVVVGSLCVLMTQVAAAQASSCPAFITGGEAGGMNCPSGLPTDTMTDYVQACLGVLAASQIASGEFSSVSYTPSCNPGGAPVPPGVSCPVAVSAVWGPAGRSYCPGAGPDACAFTATGEASAIVSEPPCFLYSVSAPSKPAKTLEQASSKNGVGEPVNPENGNVYTTEKDVAVGGPSPIEFLRFYSSADNSAAVITGGEAGGFACPNGLPTDTMLDYVQACLNALATAQVAHAQFASVTYTPTCSPGGPPVVPGVSCSVAVTARYPGGSQFSATGEASAYVSSTGADGVPGWRHSYDRSIRTLQVTPSILYPGQGPKISAQYLDAGSACTQGFASIQGSVSAWIGATATFTNGVCTLSTSAGSTATLPIQSGSQQYQSAGSQPSTTEYDLIRDDGQVLRYSSSFTAPPGTSLRLTQNGSGFVVTDDQDNIEQYNSAGVLQSITSRTGVVQTLSYDSSGHWSGVIDSFGNSLAVTRNSQGSIATVAINGGNPIQYAYDSASRLSSVTNLDGTTKSYQYGDARFVNALTAAVDENGTTLSTWTYDAQERGVATQQAGGANSTTLVYNADGSVKTTDALGATRTFSFTQVGDINQVTSISGSQCPTCQEPAATTYDTAGWVSSRTDYNGNVTCYANDPTRGLELVRVEGFAPGSICPTNLAAYTPASGTPQRVVSTTWSANYRLPTLITEATRSTAFAYDSSGNLRTKTVTDTSSNASRIWTYTYNNYGQVLTVRGPRTDLNSTRAYTYYSCTSGAQCGQVQTMTDELGHVTTFNSYNVYGRPLTITDPNGVVTTLTYDAGQRLASLTIGGETTSVSYYPTGLVQKVTRPDGGFLQNSYDGAHRLTQIADGLGNRIVYTLDALGNRVADSLDDPSNALALIRNRVFNSLSELSQQIGSAGTSAVTTSFGYDNNGNQISINAPLSRSTAKQYDTLNRLVQITDPGSGVTTFGYDANDHLTSVMDPRALTTSYTYDGFGDLVQQSSPDTGVTVNAYDSAGNLSTSTDARSQTGTYTYDAQNRVTQTAYGDQTLTFGYDTGMNGIGRLTSAGDANHSLAWNYDPLGRVISKTQTVGSGTSAITKSVSYTYTNGDLTSLVTPSGQTVTYGYTNGHVTSIAVNGNALLGQVLYEPFGPVSGWTWSNNANEARVYDEDGNVTNVEAAEGFTYNYDSAFRITGITDSDNEALSQSYGYDVLDRLTSATGASLNETWTYDANGNRLTQGGATSSTYTVATASNQLASISGGLARTYAYAASGQTTSYGALTFTYTNSGRLSSVSNGGTTTTYLINALGQRVKKSGTSTTVFVYDEAGHLLGEYDGSGNLIEETVWMGNIPVATLQPNGAGVSVYYIHTDHLNTPRRISRPADNVIVWRWDSEPFGSAPANQDPDGDGNQFVYNLRFPGQYYDTETGLNYNYYRDYDPATARYMESDPVGLTGGINTYAYVGGSAVRYRDPTGLVLQYTYSNGGTAAQLSMALAYLADSAQFRSDWAQLSDSPNTYTIDVNPNGLDGYSWQDRTITWDPTSALKIPGVGIESPALGLAHETHHGACHDRRGTSAYRKSQKTPTEMQFTNGELVVSVGVSSDEQSATLAEQIVSQQLGGGDPARSNYHQPTQPITVASPTYHVLYWPAN